MISVEQMLTDGDAFVYEEVDSGGFTPWGSPISIPDTRCKGDCGMINKRCVDCRGLEVVWRNSEVVRIGCVYGRWSLEPGDGPNDLRKYNKMAESCLEYRFTLTE